MKKKHKRLYNGSCIRDYRGYPNCIVHFKKGKIYLVEFINTPYSFTWNEYFKNGKHHRLDGPAVEEFGSNNYKRWYYEGKYIDVDSQEEFEKYLLLQAFK